MNHPHTDEFAVDHFQRLAFQHLISACVANMHGGAKAIGARAIDRTSFEQRAWRRHPHILDVPVQCAYCETMTRKILVRIACYSRLGLSSSLLSFPS